MPEKTPEKAAKPKEKAQPQPKEEKVAAKAEAKKEERKEKSEYNPWKVLKHPHLAEKSMRLVETQNSLVFFVDRKATKPQVKAAVERGFGLKVLSVNMQNSHKGRKKAYVRISPETPAIDVATRLGMV